MSDSNGDRPPRPSPLDDPQRRRLLGEEARLEGVEEETWIDVIQKMDEVYSQLLRDEVALEEKNAQLEQSQQFIFSLLSAMSDVLVACDHRGAIEETNAALRELVGRGEAELRGTSVYALLADEAAAGRLRAIVEQRGASRAGEAVEIELLDAQGRAVPVDLNCTPRVDGNGRRVGTVFVGRPMAEIKRAYRELREAHEALKRTQQQLLHSEKLASLGRLVAGVAHELNNPISFVLGNVHALQRYGQRLGQYLEAVHAHEDEATLAALRRSLRIDHVLADLPSLIDGMLEGAQRTADIVQGLKRFSAVDREEHAEVELNAVIERAIHWVCKGTAQGFRVHWTPGAPCTVSGSAGQLMQVVMNLVQNAHDAAVRPQGAEEPALCIESEADAGRVRVRFRDNGPGIPEGLLSRVFDPFFTTKPVGKGTGLGLSISYGIVERHGGRLTAGNAPQGGALFTLELPLARQAGPVG
ncbi:sensor histidine kinase [Azohydromonas caseinilytica]|uniref:histidine kinase n=1 Tax=Azohydromonas caseinilytica TaxID=2728836 RepID=A0A848F820_9BURK|nr:ATP-binding protein [Azohydromonas caseinilytica]NML15714.1 PAS domain-containing protein [Azohydromonas caseinilytica]